jgi:predicted tellurium resistance membrane protein TerC
MDEIVASLAHPDTWIALVTLSAMEVVLGIDNVIFISILVSRVPAERREKMRKAGLALALVTRLGLLAALSWLMGLTEPLFTILGQPLSGRDLILLVGGLFLIAKSTHEMHAKLEGGSEEPTDDERAKIARSTALLLAQIAVVDIVFSLDSVITAVGMASHLWIMVTAMLVSVGVMMIFAGAIGDFVDRHPTVKMLALSFLILIGVMLCVEGLGQHVSKGYIYFAMAFSLGVELLNLRLRKVSKPVKLHESFEGENPGIG